MRQKSDDPEETSLLQNCFFKLRGHKADKISSNAAIKRMSFEGWRKNAQGEMTCPQ